MSDNYIPGNIVSPSLVTGRPLTYAASMTIDLSGPKVQEVSITGNLTLAASAPAAERKVELIVRCDGSQRNLAFDSDWVFVGTKPTTIAANKTGRLTFICPTNTDEKIVCQWAVQS